MNCSTPSLSVHHQLPEFTQTRVHQVGDAILTNNYINCNTPCQGGNLIKKIKTQSSCVDKKHPKKRHKLSKMMRSSMDYQIHRPLERKEMWQCHFFFNTETLQGKCYNKQLKYKIYVPCTSVHDGNKQKCKTVEKEIQLQIETLMLPS